MYSKEPEVVAVCHCQGGETTCSTTLNRGEVWQLFDLLTYLAHSVWSSKLNIYKELSHLTTLECGATSLFSEQTYEI